MMNFIFILSFPFSVNGENPAYMISLKKKSFDVGLYSDMYRPNSF